MTFSIVARDAATGQLGVAVASKFLAVGSVVPAAVAGIGAIATQADANVAYKPMALAHLDEDGSTVTAGVTSITAQPPAAPAPAQPAPRKARAVRTV